MTLHRVVLVAVTFLFASFAVAAPAGAAPEAERLQRWDDLIAEIDAQRRDQLKFDQLTANADEAEKVILQRRHARAWTNAYATLLTLGEDVVKAEAEGLNTEPYRDRVIAALAVADRDIGRVIEHSVGELTLGSDADNAADLAADGVATDAAWGRLARVYHGAMRQVNLHEGLGLATEDERVALKGYLLDDNQRIRWPSIGAEWTRARK